jgi:flagellar motor switch protein FliN/FliY
MKSRSQPEASPDAAQTTKPDTSHAKGPNLVSLDAAIFKDVKVELQAKLGRVTLSVEDVLALKSGAVVKLEARMNDLIELRLNDSLVARGEIVAVDDNFGVRIVEIAQVA